MRKNLWAVVVLVVGALVSFGMWFAGEVRILRLGLAVWSLPVIVAVLVAAVVLGVQWQRRAFAAARDEAASKARADARQLHRTFVGRLDHELKNPITALRVALPGVTDPQLAVAMGGQLERLASLVADLRKISEIDDYPLANEAVDLREIVDEVLDAVDTSDRELSLVFPKAPRPLPTARGDRDLIFLALFNLVSNAVKYSEPGATIEVRGSEDRGWVLVDISDTGRGIAAADVDAVWSELARGQDVRHIPGNGLGLPMVAAVLRRLGGACELSSIQGRGTTVRVRLPVA